MKTATKVAETPSALRAFIKMASDLEPPRAPAPPEIRWAWVRRMIVPILVGVFSTGGMIAVYQIMEP